MAAALPRSELESALDGAAAPATGRATPAADGAAPASKPKPTFSGAGFCSALTFSWLNSLMATGAKRALEQEDLPPLDPDDTCCKLRRRLAALWAAEQQRPRPSLMRAVLHLSGWANVARAPIYLVGSCVRICNALLLGALIRHVQDPRAPFARGAWLAAGMVSCTLLYTLAHAMYFFMGWREGMRLRVAMLGLMFDKAARLSLRGLHGVTLGGVTNMASTDVEKFQVRDCCCCGCGCWCCCCCPLSRVLLYRHRRRPPSMELI